MVSKIIDQAINTIQRIGVSDSREGFKVTKFDPVILTYEHVFDLR